MNDKNMDTVRHLLAGCVPPLRRTLDNAIPQEFQAVISIDDVLQETFVRVYLKWGTFHSQGEGSFLAWVRRIAKNTLNEAVRMLRAQKRGGNVTLFSFNDSTGSTNTLLDYLKVSTTSPSRLLSMKELRAFVGKAIDTLPEIHGTVVRMYDMECIPAEEVAAAVGRRVGAMYMIRARAHSRLAEMLEGFAG